MKHPVGSGESMAQHKLTHRDLDKPVSCATGESHTIKVALPDLTVRLAMDPKQAEEREDRFTLQGTGSGPAFHQTKVLKVDKKPGDKYVDLVFTRLRPGYSYTLSVDLGAEGKRYHAFEELTLPSLID